ncbi:hypothetical protein [Mycobacteroides abscessus]|uniref:hypothetical protein n=1 Tax=Mycobacteroides abscessus TaxID=36809 RepID=UPI000C25C265|nr:hypothetical protein [Mycobacteroides abscessus]
MRNPEADVVDAIAALVDEQLQQEASGYDHNINQDSCPKCGGPWHGLVRGSCPGATGIRGSDPERLPAPLLAQLTIPATPRPWTEQRHSYPVTPSDDETLLSEFILVIAEPMPIEFRAVETPEEYRLLPSRHWTVDIRCESSYAHATDMLWLRIRFGGQYLRHIVPYAAVYGARPGLRLLHTSIPNLADSYVELFTHPTYGVVAWLRIKGGAFQLRLRFAGLGHP